MYGPTLGEIVGTPSWVIEVFSESEGDVRMPECSVDVALIAVMITAVCLAQGPDKELSAIPSEGQVRELKTSASKGNAYAQDILADMYSEGRGVPQDYKEAVRLWRLAAEQGILSAEKRLADAYEWGKGVPQNYEEALQLYRHGALSGNVATQLALAEMYKTGQGVPADYKEAVRWWLIISNGPGDGSRRQALAQVSLAHAYFVGEGVPQDYVEAYKWYNLANVVLPVYSFLRDKVAEKMTPSQIERAQELSRQWKPSGR